MVKVDNDDEVMKEIEETETPEEKAQRRLEKKERKEKKEKKREAKKEKKEAKAEAEGNMGETEKKEKKAADRQDRLVRAASSSDAISGKPREKLRSTGSSQNSQNGSNASNLLQKIGSGSSHSHKPKKVSKDQNPNLRSTALKAKGIKYGVTAVHTSEVVSTDGTEDEEFFWHEEKAVIKNPCWRCIHGALIWTKCLVPEDEENRRVKNMLCWVQWAALLADISAALTAIITFNGVAYCCGTPILNNGGTNIPWHTLIRILTYVYLALVFLEIYPVVKKGFPFNLVNPLVGFIITLAMFFDDSKVQALMMWGIETFAVLCEFGVFRLKVIEKAQRAKDVKRIGKLTNKEFADDVDIEEAKKELKKTRQRYYQLQQEQLYEDKVLWYLRVGVYINISLVLMFLALIICISQAGGLCVHGDTLPNPFNLHPLDSCTLCEGDGMCEICSEEEDQCYFPYS
jgi:hypothetical protein